MKTNPKISNAVILLFAISPTVYLLLTWNSVPQTILTRFTLNETVVKEQSRQALLIASIMLSMAAAGIYLLLRNLRSIDPKVKSAAPTSGFNRMGLAITIFLVLVNYCYVLSALHSWEISKKVIFIFLGLLLATLGNYMNNIKPNFFVGIRLPWTLNDENNWRLTHRLAGKLWFLGGILLALICVFLPDVALRPVFIGMVILIVLIPCIYSYKLFRSHK
jgi:uncharacterized membrane protein